MWQLQEGKDIELENAEHESGIGLSPVSLDIGTGCKSRTQKTKGLKMGTEHDGIMEVRKFVDHDGREVLQFTQMFGKAKDPDFYKGRVMVRIQPTGPNGPMPPQMVPFEFLFPEGTGLKKAFDTFDAVAKKEVDEHAKQMREKHEKTEKPSESKVIPVRTMPSILGADGKIARLK